MLCTACYKNAGRALARLCIVEIRRGRQGNPQVPRNRRLHKCRHVGMYEHLCLIQVGADKPGPNLPLKTHDVVHADWRSFCTAPGALDRYAVSYENSVLVVCNLQAAVLSPTARRSASRSVTTRW